MKYIITIFCWLIFSIAAVAQETVVPIAYSSYLLGGTKNGKWLTAQDVAPMLKGRIGFVAVGLKDVKKDNLIFGTKGEEFGACPDVWSINFETQNKPMLTIGKDAKWNLFPRAAQAIALTDKNNTKIVADFLKTKGIAKTNIKLTQALSVDLDGDGQNEIFMAGNYYKRGMQSEQSVGDYSFVLLRKSFKGKPKNILVEGEFFTRKGGEYDPPNEREIPAIADLNGDGKMEIVLHTFYYEGEQATIYQLRDNKLEKTIEIDCGL